MTLHFYDSSHSSIGSSKNIEAFRPPDSGYTMMFVVNLDEYETHGAIAKNIADASILFYRYLACSRFCKKLNQWEKGGEKKEVYFGMNQSHLEYIKRLTQFLHLPFVCISESGLAKGIKIIAIFGTNTAIGHISDELYPYD